MTFKELETIFNKHLSFDTEPDFLRVVVSTIIANRIDTTPVWLMILGPASSGKSEILSSMSACPETYELSMITPAALISNVHHEKKKGKDESLLPKLNGKVLIFKDASTLTTINPNYRSFVFSQLRDAFDGNLSKHTTHGETRHKAKFGIIMAALLL